jgi:hypothetical protein
VVVTTGMVVALGETVPLGMTVMVTLVLTVMEEDTVTLGLTVMVLVVLTHVVVVPLGATVVVVAVAMELGTADAHTTSRDTRRAVDRARTSEDANGIVGISVVLR